MVRRPHLFHTVNQEKKIKAFLKHVAKFINRYYSTYLVSHPWKANATNQSDAFILLSSLRWTASRISPRHPRKETGRRVKETVPSDFLHKAVVMVMVVVEREVIEKTETYTYTDIRFTGKKTR